jgi:hypothetical protein
VTLSRALIGVVSSTGACLCALRFRVIGIVLLILAVLDLVRGHVPLAVLLWLVGGIAAGYPFGHLTKVAWDSETSQVVQDGAGFVLLAIYAGVRLGEHFLLSAGIIDLPCVTNGPALIGAGRLIGRFIGMRRAIRRALVGRD